MLRSQTNLSLEVDVVKKLKEKGVVLSHLVNRLLRTYLKEPVKAEVLEALDLKCSGCKAWIHDEFYYQCKYHKNIFCERCCKNDYISRIAKRDAKTCMGFEHEDHIFEKKEVIIKEVDED